MLWPLHGSVTSPEEVMPKGTCAPAQPAPEHPQPARNKAIPGNLLVTGDRYVVNCSCDQRHAANS